MKIETTRKRMVEFSAISLTDIVLLLLVFFMLTSSFVIQPGIKVKLPKASSGEQAQNNRIYLTVTRDERIFLNQHLVNRSELGQQLRKMLSENPDQLVVIRADKEISLDATVKIVDIAKLAGAEKFMIATEQGL